MNLTIGVDVGNFDTKSVHTNTVSGYTVYNNEQLLADKVLAYKGKYYVESQDNRFPYVEDKTNNDQCLILTLFSIAKEIMWRIENEKHLKGNYQSEISNINGINLPIGLPPGHFNKLAKQTQTYYNNAFANGIDFTYAGYKFSLKLARSVEVYAQDMSPVVMNSSLSVNELDENGERVVHKYYVVGIGGYTVDIVPIINGKPAVDECRSLPLGTRPMFETIIARLQSSAGITFEEAAIENILRGKRSFVAEDVKAEIRQNAEQYANQIIDRCIQAGCTLNQSPVVYVGGGPLLLRSFLENNSKVCFSEFIEDTHANAKSYEDFMKMKYKLTA